LRRRGFRLAGLIHGFAQLHGRSRQGFHPFINGGDVFAGAIGDFWLVKPRAASLESLLEDLQERAA
jgi:hypothetical protein